MKMRVERTYTMRSGLTEGLKQRGGLRLGVRQLTGRWSPERQQEERFLKRLPITGTVYDIGGFEGMHTIFFASRVAPDGRVVTFKPVPENVAKIRANVAVNGLENVEVRQVGVADAPGERTFHLIAGETSRTSADPAIGHSLDAEGAEALNMTVTSIDAEVAAGTPAPDFVKIDVEGLELDVLRGMTNTIGACRPRLFIELHGMGSEDNRANAVRVCALLLQHQYDVVHAETGSRISAADSTPFEGHLYCT